MTAPRIAFAVAVLGLAQVHGADTDLVRLANPLQGTDSTGGFSTATRFPPSPCRSR